MSTKQLEVSERLPRTNADAASWWADGVLLSEPRPHRNVNSVHCEGDAIYSYGHHFPMAVMVRNSRGRVTRVVLNSDYWPSSGWSHTSNDQYNVGHAVRERAERAPWKVEVVRMPLTNHGSSLGLRVRPAYDDPEPDPYPRVEVPVPYHASNPGPEPVDDGVGCIAGREEAYEYQEDRTLYYEDPKPSDFFLPDYGDLKRVRRSYTGTLVWGKDYWSNRSNEPGVTCKQCPHCKAFQERHLKWRRAMEGPGRGRNYDHGYLFYRKMMDRFGSYEAWKAGRKADWHRAKRARERRREWVERNYVPREWVPNLKPVPYNTARRLIPRLDPDGYVYRSHVAQAQAAHRRRVREQAKAAEEARLRAIEYEKHMKREREERELRLAEARAEWTAAYGVQATGEVVEWCITNGIKPNDDGTVTLYKAVWSGTLESDHGMVYEIGTTVEAPDYEPTRRCGQGLHFGPTMQVAIGYHGGGSSDVAILHCRVPLETLVPLNDKCKAKSCYVEKQVPLD